MKVREKFDLEMIIVIQLSFLGLTHYIINASDNACTFFFLLFLSRFVCIGADHHLHCTGLFNKQHRQTYRSVSAIAHLYIKGEGEEKLSRRNAVAQVEFKSFARLFFSHFFFFFSLIFCTSVQREEEKNVDLHGIYIYMYDSSGKKRDCPLR